jgi:hypothetical protein
MTRLIAAPELAIAMPPAGDIIGTHELSIDDGVVCVGSDCHYRPDEPASTVHRALVELVSRFAEEGSLQAVILNGDVADFPSVSRHARIGWEAQPKIADELAVIHERLEEIGSVAGVGTPLLMTLGNHDIRLSSRLSERTPEFEGVLGFDLRDHLPVDWQLAWQIEINGSGTNSVLVRHRFRGGHSAGRSNVLAAGRTVISGHVHQPNISRLTTAAGHLWGVDCGMVAARNSRAFLSYTEGSAAAAMSNWASGFVILTFRDGLLMPPEPVLVLNEEAGTYAFRGEVFHVRTVH